MRARYYCPNCLTSRDFDGSASGEFACSGCGRAVSARFESVEESGGIARCAFCGNRAFFRQKDFDQRLGCVVLALSLGLALLVGWRFGWIWFTPALLATVLVDWMIAARVRPVTICYRCDAEYRDVPLHPRHRAYDPHIAERYARIKTVRRMR